MLTNLKTILDVAYANKYAVGSFNGYNSETFRGIIEAGKENVSNVLLDIKGNGSDAGIRAVTIEQFKMFIEALNKHLETANIIWGMGDNEENRENISILIILGYDK